MTTANTLLTLALIGFSPYLVIKGEMSIGELLILHAILIVAREIGRR